MIASSKTRKADRELFNSSYEDFIPIACHYDENTLLTKNGELIQTIRINGINAENISSKLRDLRQIVRNAIRTHFTNNDFAIWVHTIRHKADLDDQMEYNKLLPANIHDRWKSKNYWSDKFVNTLYVSVIYNAATIKVRNFASLMNSLSFKLVTDFQDKYFRDGVDKLNNVVNNLLKSLEEYNAARLKVKFNDSIAISEPLSLYYEIIHLKMKECPLLNKDLSSYLAADQYAIGGDKIEVITKQGKKFAAMLSIKEYRDISAESFNMFLQLPIHFIATEVFYFLDRKEMISAFKEYDRILKISGDANLREIKDLTRINDLTDSIRFCKQQISISISSDSMDQLEIDAARASEELAKIGIVHIREDINLEQTYWAQLPGNFSFLRRMTATTLQDAAALTSLHNFPIGEKYSKWGRALTLLRTDKGTPYFMNFHSLSRRGNTCVFGTNRTGKTVLTNFLISESTKFNPTILYLAANNDSQIFINAIEGQWIANELNIINPLICDDNEYSRQLINEFLRIICNHYLSPLEKAELNFLSQLTIEIFNLQNSDRNISSIPNNHDFSSPAGKLIKSRLSMFDTDGTLQGLFDGANESKFLESSILGLNLHIISKEYFTAKFFPEDEKPISEFSVSLEKVNSARVGLIYVLANHFMSNKSHPKILVMDNINSLIDLENFAPIVSSIVNGISQSNGIVLSSVNLQTFQSLASHSWQYWQELNDTQIILPSDVKIENIENILNLSRFEISKLANLTIASRMFLIKQDEQSIIAELSLGNFIAITKILSAGSDELEIFNQLIEGRPEEWIKIIYEILDGRDV